MFQQFNVSRTTFGAYQKFLFNLTNNIANLKTPGFKTSRVEFSTVFPDILNETEKAYASEEQNSPYLKKKRGVDLITGIRMSAINKNFSQGNLELTKNKLDFAIQGKGFFQFRNPDGDVVYSRAGNLVRTADGVIRNQSGYPLEPEIRVPENTSVITVDQEGRVYIKLDNDMAAREIAQVPLANFPNPEGLETVGNSLYSASRDSGEAIVEAAGFNGNGQIIQYARESSNVDVFKELMDMIMAQRGIELMGAAMESGSKMLEKGMTIVDKT